MKYSIRVKPSASEEKIEAVADGQFEVWVKEPPIQGRANRAVIAALAQHFGVVPSRVSIVSGYTSRQKTIEVR